MDKTELQRKLTQPFDPDRWKDVVESVFPGSQFYLDMTSFGVNSDALWLLGGLNSQVVGFFFSKLGIQRRGGCQEFKTQYVSQIPFPAATPAQQKEIEALVEQILALKKENPDTDVSALEGEIDQLVYKLYNLTPEEVAIIEGRA